MQSRWYRLLLTVMFMFGFAAVHAAPLHILVYGGIA